MIRPAAEQLTSQFYDWERLGRGWLLYDTPVTPEPPFYPFMFHQTPRQAAVPDDSRVPNLFGKIGKLFSRKKEEIEEDEENPEYIAEPFDCIEELIFYTVTLPKGTKVSILETEQLLVMLTASQYPLSFEIIAGHTEIVLQLAARESDSSYAFNQIKAFFPECIVKDSRDILTDILDECIQGAVYDYGLQQEFMRPVAMADRSDSDPFIGVFAALEQLREGEYIVIQTIFQGTVHSWAESIMRSVTDNEGGLFFANAPEMLPLAKEKIAYPLCGVTMKAFVASQTARRSLQLLEIANSAVGRIFINSGNCIVPITEDIEEYDFDIRLRDIILRESHRGGMLLNIRELATIVHLPNTSVVSSKLKRDVHKTKAAPVVTEGHDLVLGTNEHQGREKLVTVSSAQRLRHTHLIGATGTGKSTLLHSMIVQDIKNGNGVAVLDPHGDLIESILAYIPVQRHKDVILIDPSDGEFPVGFNILSAHSEVEKDILSSDLVAAFRRLSTSWGDQMNSVFANAILAFVESTEGGTLVDLRRFLVEKSFRDAYLKSVSDPNVVYYWQKEFPLLKSGSIGPILTRLDTFLRPKLIRNMVAQKKSLDFETILDSQKILLIKLSQGLIGTENSYLLGTFFVTKIYQAAMARQMQSKENRKDFFLYVDEFQNFITPSMSLILSGARKYHLGLILAHQDMTQLNKYDSELASSVVSNAGTRICFRLGDTDAKRFASGFASFEPSDLENLNIGQAVGRIERPEHDFSLTTLPQPNIELERTESNTEAVISLSRQTYGTPKQEVEALLESLIGTLHEDKEEAEIPKYKKNQAPVVLSQSTPEPVELPITTSHENIIKKKEESQHRYLQALIKRMAEARGYKSLIEQPTPDGKGRVDVHLERNSKKIAVEICNTTEPDWEVHNIEKCFNAGYDLIVACSNEKKSLDNIRKKTALLNTDIQDRLVFFEPEALFQYLDQEMAKEASTEVRTKGYRVKVEYSPVSGDEAKHMNNSIIKTVTEAARKIR